MKKPIYVEGEKDGIQVEIAIQYNDGYTEIFIRLQIIFILMKVEHMKQVLRAALTRIINDYAEKINY